MFVFEARFLLLMLTPPCRVIGDGEVTVVAQSPVALHYGLQLHSDVRPHQLFTRLVAYYASVSVWLIPSLPFSNMTDSPSHRTTMQAPRKTSVDSTNTSFSRKSIVLRLMRALLRWYDVLS